MVKVTYTLDQVTAAAVRELSTEWGVPQSEVVRRAIRQARQQQLLQPKVRSPIEVLERLEGRPSLSAAESEARLRSARQLRKSWNLRKAR
jgi:transposase-like protein